MRTIGHNRSVAIEIRANLIDYPRRRTRVILVASGFTIKGIIKAVGNAIEKAKNNRRAIPAPIPVLIAVINPDMNNLINKATTNECKSRVSTRMMNL